MGDTSVLGHTVSTAQRAGLGPVWVLAADAAIEDEATRVGAQVLRVEGPWRNGSERIAAALRRGLLGEPIPELVVNLQGDAVGVTPGALSLAVEALRQDPQATLGTCAVRAAAAEHCGHTTLTVQEGRALAFSRSPLPTGLADSSELLLHLGLYAYRTADLLRVAALAPTAMEQLESLEQLRWLESGRKVAVQIAPGPAQRAHAINVPSDLAAPPAGPPDNARGPSHGHGSSTALDSFSPGDA